MNVLIGASALMLVLRHFCYVGRHVLIGASALLLVLRYFCYVGRHSDRCFGTPATATTLLLRGQARSDQCFGTPASATTPQYCIVPSGTYYSVSYSFLMIGLGSQTVI